MLCVIDCVVLPRRIRKCSWFPLRLSCLVMVAVSLRKKLYFLSIGVCSPKKDIEEKA